MQSPGCQEILAHIAILQAGFLLIVLTIQRQNIAYHNCQLSCLEKNILKNSF
jgi:hypothetical protein